LRIPLKIMILVFMYSILISNLRVDHMIFVSLKNHHINVIVVKQLRKFKEYISIKLYLIFYVIILFSFAVLQSVLQFSFIGQFCDRIGFVENCSLKPNLTDHWHP
jgi:hypothetical protein